MDDLPLVTLQYDTCLLIPKKKEDMDNKLLWVSCQNFVGFQSLIGRVSSLATSIFIREQVNGEDSMLGFL